jgi:molybdenum cofactor cytidylyltransferase
MSLVAVVLAAGQGSRFRQVAGAQADKLMAVCAGLDGQAGPVLGHVLKGVAHKVQRCLLVTRPENPAVIALATAYGCELLLLDSAGMGDSLAAAVRASSAASGWLVMLGDMPFIHGSTLDAVLGAMDEQSIAVPVGEQGYGHPVAFGQAFASQLMALAGDQGARKLFAPGSVIQVPVSDPGIYQDVDIPAALQR